MRFAKFNSTVTTTEEISGQRAQSHFAILIVFSNEPNSDGSGQGGGLKVRMDGTS